MNSELINNEELIVNLENNSEIDTEIYPRGPKGESGPKGEDAKINGFNTIEIVAGQNIQIEQIGNKLIINVIGIIPENHLETIDGNIFKTIDDEYFVLKESD